MGRFRTSDGIALRYERRGSGPPVYVCHGGPNNICDTLIEQLAPLEDHFTLVFHDYRGSGQSANASADTYRFGRLGDDLAELRRHLGDDPAAVLAHSMGGFVALNAVLDHPEGFHRLALVGTSPCDDPKTMVWPTLRALGPMRTLRTLGLLAQFLVVWSWRPASLERTTLCTRRCASHRRLAMSFERRWRRPSPRHPSTTTTRLTSSDTSVTPTSAPD